MSVDIKPILAGEVRAGARLMRDLDDRRPDAMEALKALFPHTGKAYVVGVTGNPGAGKSTVVDALIAHYRAAGERVGVIAVDPTSPFSGGAILGDRIRMQDLTADGGVFMRSMASRGNLGGLAETASGVVDVMDAAGYDVVIVETVGAGQDEVEVATATQTTVLVTTPAGGDDVQSMKAGLMEIAQVMVVNKADLAGADTAAMQLRGLLAIAPPRPWEPPILMTVARNNEGLDALVDKIDAHQDYLRTSGHADDERRALAQAQIVSLARAALHRQALETAQGEGILSALVEEVAARRQDPRAAAGVLLEAVRTHWGRG